jgi:putative protein kinase ArgK-like GTPase of G3E family
MTERWELVELIGQTLEDHNIETSNKTLDAVLDSIESLIRADERERQEEGWAARLNSTVAWAENGVRDDLIAQVEALRDKWQRSVDRDPDGKLSGYDRAHVAALGDVLALIDGGSDD